MTLHTSSKQCLYYRPLLCSIQASSTLGPSLTQDGPALGRQIVSNLPVAVIAQSCQCIGCTYSKSGQPSTPTRQQEPDRCIDAFCASAAPPPVAGSCHSFLTEILYGCSRPRSVGDVAHQEEVVSTLEKALEGSANVRSPHPITPCPVSPRQDCQCRPASITGSFVGA